VTTKADIARLHRLAAVRETFSSVAEARLREAQGEVIQIEREDERVVRNIQDTRADFAQRSRLTGLEIKQNERHVDALAKQRTVILQSLEKAKTKVVQKQELWVEARREQKIIERVEETRLQEWRREEQIALQKAADDAFIGRFVRTQSKR
jgi:flagellar protein FliJ